MRTYIVPVALAAMVVSSTFALAAEHTDGIIKTFDAMGHNLTLQDGTMYKLPSSFKDPGLKSGQKVTVTWEMEDGQHMASDVRITK